MSEKGESLHDAITDNSMKKVKELIESSADIDARYYGWTPLQLAINQGATDIAVYLIENNCNISCHQKNSSSPFEDALHKKQSKVVQALIEKGTDENEILITGCAALPTAVEAGDLKTVRVLTKGCSDCDVVNKNGDTSLFVAARRGYSEIVECLLDAGADVNFVSTGCGLQTPLIAAATHEHDDTARTILKYGCNVNAQDADGWTALWHAYSTSNEDLVRLLLKHGADKHVVNSEGKTIMEQAKDSEEENIMELLQKF